MIPEAYREIKKIGVSETSLPYITFGNDLTFHGLDYGERSEMVKAILRDVYLRHLSQRPHRQHAYYKYKPGDTVVEIGAFLGYYSMWVAMQVGLTGKMIAIEAIPEYVRILKENLKPFPQAEVIEKAAGNYQGTGKIYVGARQTCGMREDVVAQFNETVSAIEVEVDTVDNILADYDSIDMMIIQVNGTELDVLEGMENTLPKIKNIVVASQYDDSDGISHIEVVEDILYQDELFECLDDGVVVYGRRPCEPN
jgi:FkbM family methyltransferase